MKKITNLSLVNSSFYIYDSKYESEYTQQKPIKDFPKFLLSAEKHIKNGISKDNANAFIINQLKTNNNRKTDNFESANVIMIDIDFKSDEQIDNFKKQYNKYDNNLSFNKNLNIFIEDCSSLAWITARSFSKNGIHLFFYFLNTINDGELIIVEDENDVWTVNDIHKSNYKAAEEMITKKTGYKLNDKCGLVITQPTLPCWKTGSYVNYENIYVKNFKFIANKKLKNNITKEQAIKLNNDLNINVERLEKLICDTKIELHYEDVLPIFSALQLIKDEKIRIMFYNFVKENYNGTSLCKKLRSYQNFYKYCDNINFVKYNVPLSFILNKYNLFVDDIKHNNQEDLYGRTFDKIYYYDEYLTHFDIENNEDIIINANTGAGKTTVAIDYLSKKEGVKAFVCPTNMIADQTYEKYNNKFNLKKCYNGNFDQMMFNDEECIYICNIQSLKLLNNIKFTSVVYDECHKLIDYSIFNENNNNKPYIYLNSDQNIYISATSDKWKCFKTNIKYIKYIKNDTIKRDIHIKNFKNNNMRFEMLKYFIENNQDKNVVIFHNNKNENKDLQKSLSKYNYSLIDSENKGDSYDNIINNNVAENIIVTSVINDGVNINNKVDYVFIIDNMTQSVEDLYQFCNRFRKSNPFIYFLRLNNKTKDENYRSIKIYDLIDKLYQDKIKKYEADCLMYNNFEHSYEVKTADNQYAKFIIEKITNEKCFYKIGDVYYINYQLVMREIINNINNNILGNVLDFNFYMSYYFNLHYKKTNTDVAEKNINEKTKKDAKNLFFKYYNKKNEVKKLIGEEKEIYIKYKNTIDNYFKRYCEVEAISNDINNEVIFDINKLTADRTIYNNELKGFVLKVSKKREEKKMLFEKGDLLNLQNNNQILNILENVKTMDEFIFSIKDLNILESNKIDTTDMKSINKGIKKFGYRFRERNNIFVLRKI